MYILVALAPQVEFELLEGMQQQNTSWQRHQVVRIVLRTLASRWNKQKFRCYEAKIEESEKAGGQSEKAGSPGVLGSIPAGLFTFLYFRLITSKLLFIPT